MYIGFDTSNYTTSVAVFDGSEMRQSRQILSVKSGQRGLRQSDAVFQHTVNLPVIIEKLDLPLSRKIDAVGVSVRPRNVEGSYMPCFLVGRSAAAAVSKFSGALMYETSHQVGHILAALYSVGKIDLIEHKFIAFHVSGGTTEALLVTPDKENIITAQVVSKSLDLKAGQAVDRTGIALGLDFPCGAELDALSLKSDREFKVKPVMIGGDCSLSGVENKAHNMLKNGESHCDIAKYVLSFISASIDAMAAGVLKRFGDLPIVFAGGVMSNTLIRRNLTKKYDALFANPQYSCDNACGTALFAYLKDRYE